MSKASRARAAAKAVATAAANTKKVESAAAAKTKMSATPGSMERMTTAKETVLGKLPTGGSQVSFAPSALPVKGGMMKGATRLNAGVPSTGARAGGRLGGFGTGAKPFNTSSSFRPRGGSRPQRARPSKFDE